MSDSLLITALCASLLRSVIVCSIAGLLLPLFSGWIQRSGTRAARMTRELLCVLPFFTPDLLTGFHYRLTASAWAGISGGISYVLLTELLYGILQLFRAVALGMLLRHVIPAPTDSSEALYSWQLLRSRMPRLRWYREWYRLQLAGPWRNPLLTWSLTAVVIFQEFETAALMQIDQHPWSVCLMHTRRGSHCQHLSDSQLRDCWWNCCCCCPVWSLPDALATAANRSRTLADPPSLQRLGRRSLQCFWSACP